MTDVGDVGVVRFAGNVLLADVSDEGVNLWSVESPKLLHIVGHKNIVVHEERVWVQKLLAKLLQGKADPRAFSGVYSRKVHLTFVARGNNVDITLRDPKPFSGGFFRRLLIVRGENIWDRYDSIFHRVYLERKGFGVQVSLYKRKLGYIKWTHVVSLLRDLFQW